MSEFTDYKKEIMDAAHNERIRLALSRAIKSYRGNTSDALKKFPHTIKMAEEVREIKSNAVANMEKLAEQASQAIEANKGKAYIAKTAKDALDIIDKLVGPPKKLIVSGKSMTSEEVGVRHHLEGLGHDFYETDLGEFIVQKLESRPMHILSHNHAGGHRPGPAPGEVLPGRRRHEWRQRGGRGHRHPLHHRERGQHPFGHWSATDAYSADWDGETGPNAG
jgi:hypothetical protein